jgi:pyruvate dehydrogenase E2 component (dihydrolipoamide acetyltransferase)
VATPVTMPQLGETVVEGTITRWLKNEGESIERDEPLFEISTDKVDTEVPSPMGGKISKILVPEGETVRVGTELVLIETDGAQPAESAAPSSDAAESAEADGQAQPKQEPAPAPPEVPPAEAPVEQPVAPPSEASADVPPEAANAPEAAAPGAAAEPTEGGGPRSKILSPIVRRLAEEHDVDLAQVVGSGTGGRIQKNDVLDFVASRSERPAPEPPPSPTPPEPVPAPPPIPQPAPPTPPAAGGDREEVVPLSRMRQAIAANMVAAMQTTARAWNLVEVNMENIAGVRNAAKDSFRAREGVSLTYMPFVARAVCDALMAFPDVNGEIREDQLVLKHYVNLGIAVALDDGLIVPVVKGADTMNVVGLARAINDVATRARNKHLRPDDVHGGTFTITNPGPFGSIISVPIINRPQCAILAFDAIEKRPVVIDDAIAIRHMVYLSMSWDHRIIDGATAAKFLGRLKQNLETWDFGPEVGLPARG